jgi:hypothetical protein
MTGVFMKSLTIHLLALNFLTFWTSPARSAWDFSELPPGFSVADPGVPVELESKILFRVRVNAKQFTAQQRAVKFSKEILKLAQDPTFNPDTITVKDHGISSDVMVGDKIIVPVWAFAAKLEGRPAEELARDYGERTMRPRAYASPRYRIKSSREPNVPGSGPPRKIIWS